MENSQRHSTSTHIVEPPFAQVDAGRDLLLKIKVACPFGCNLQSGKVIIKDDSGADIKEIALAAFDGSVNESAEFAITAPNEPGEYRLTARFEDQTSSGLTPTDLTPGDVAPGDVAPESLACNNLEHEASSAQLSFVVKPHATSIAIWNVPSYVMGNDRFGIKVGVQCCAECNLAGQIIEVCNDEQVQLATATLGDEPLPATNALHWAEVELQAPDAEGLFNWTVRLPRPELALAHDEATQSFAFRVARAPEHVVTVEIVDKVEGNPIASAQVILHPYRGFSDERGIARIGVATGDYDLWIPKILKYRKFVKTVHVDGDIELRAELVAIPEDPS